MKCTVYASFRPSTATSRWLPVKWRHFRSLSSRDVIFHHVTASSCEPLDRGEVLRLKANEKLGLTGEERQKLDAKIEDEREAIYASPVKREREAHWDWIQSRSYGLLQKRWKEASCFGLKFNEHFYVWHLACVSRLDTTKSNEDTINCSSYSIAHLQNYSTCPLSLLSNDVENE